jgi:thiopeptide-type bacteriocin biosynthesis protein
MNYIPGDEWIYYRFYSGHEIADKLLQKILFPFLFKMEAQGIIQQWFFIRYSDPEKHIRLRVKFTDLKQMSYLIFKVNTILKSYIETKLVWKVEMGTYQPEYERYGKRSMHHVERLFHSDSVAYGSFILSGYDVQINARWLYAIYAADQLMQDFGFTMDQKKQLLLGLSRSFGREFGKDKVMAKQLSNKFRENRQFIAQMISGEDQSEMAMQIREIIHKRSVSKETDVSKIKHLISKYGEVKETNLLSSLIHMSLNRIFRNNNRMHEMVIYDLLFRYYKSAVVCKLH